MKENYASMSQEELAERKRSLHKKLLVPNILVLLLSLVAAATLLFLPLLDLRIAINEQVVSAVLSQTADAGGEADGTEGGVSGADSQQEMIRFIFRDVNQTVSVKADFFELISASTGEGNTGLRALAEKKVDELIESLEPVLEQAMPAALAVFVMDELPEEISTEAFDPVIEKLSENDVDGAVQLLGPAVTTFIRDELGEEVDEADVEAYVESFSPLLYDAVDEDGNFSYLAFAGEVFAQGSGEESGDLIGKLKQQILAQIDEMDEQTLDMAKIGILAAAIAFCGLSAACWLILALFALGHIFASNKKLGMWYVKLTGLLPWLVFAAIPTAALMLAPDILASAGQDMPSQLEMIQSAQPQFLGFTFVSALCLLALWLISVFGCFPVKRKIRAIEKQMKRNKKRNRA